MAAICKCTSISHAQAAPRRTTKRAPVVRCVLRRCVPMSSVYSHTTPSRVGPSRFCFFFLFLLPLDRFSHVRIMHVPPFSQPLSLGVTSESPSLGVRSSLTRRLLTSDVRPPQTAHYPRRRAAAVRPSHNSAAPSTPSAAATLSSDGVDGDDDAIAAAAACRRAARAQNPAARSPAARRAGWPSCPAADASSGGSRKRARATRLESHGSDRYSSIKKRQSYHGVARHLISTDSESHDSDTPSSAEIVRCGAPAASRARIVESSSCGSTRPMRARFET